ncbi:MAG: energy-coupling factor transporter transmembrane protein EcfT [Caldilinea sp.]|nr:energy-coupling factor transporter transmembrane protein EcfT [Caldilinea sp.]MCB0049323.1 energy-coupling factor transporter transmembrane protein EcfT [Caldilinea sp.]MCB0133836.1 energy-coupling factor transporter transmembrane protein EcfT [Caldilineaceae bacterium]MCO5210237.1 energy-coupling factor transporter transmembrane protein EcfT [Caldilinea sp.]HRW46849.1 energy-coupling factor transporter transmembrane component T [Caldilinea sp.]
MSEFEFLRNVTIGQYIPEDSIIHRLDPRTKLIGALLFALAVSSTRSVIATVLVLALLMGVIVLSKLPILYVLRGLLPGLPFLIFLFAMQILFQGGNIPCGVTWFEWWFVRITPCLAELVVLGMLRVVAFLYIVSLLTLTTTSSYLTHGIEILLAPLQRIGLPVHEFALANMIALRFIPTLAEELERTAKAQASRGGDFGNAPWYRPDIMARARLPLIIPLFVNALRRAEDLVLAMEARSYVGGKGRTKFVELHFGAADWVAIALSLLVWLAVWLLPWPTLRTWFPYL